MRIKPFLLAAVRLLTGPVKLRVRSRAWALFGAATLLSALPGLNAGEVLAVEEGHGAGPRQPVPVIPPTAAVDVILGRPSSNSITLSLLCRERAEKFSIDFSAPGTPARSQPAQCEKDRPQEIVLTGLGTDQAYTYQLRRSGARESLVHGSFHTQRPPGSRFTLTITADSHLDGNTDAALYARTLANVKSDAPDFHIDLGDTFMTGKHANREGAMQQYLAQRAWLGQLSNTQPLFLVVGNHDGEERRYLRQGKDNLAVWANQMRKRYFPNPTPDSFYSGNVQPDAEAGLLQDYYAFRWGDALFIVLNPYWHGNRQRSEAPWELSLGDTQYQWLRRTLAQHQHAAYKFIFVHQLVGGLGRQGRGGVEALNFGEWGGNNADGTPGFNQQRPGWEQPIHPLLVRHHVTAVFHGHDHLYAQQSRDGVVYQAVPQPGHPGDGTPRFAEEYGYRGGVILGGAGHLRLQLAPAQASVEFVRVSRNEQQNKQVAHRYLLPKRP